MKKTILSTAMAALLPLAGTAFANTAGSYAGGSYRPQRQGAAPGLVTSSLDGLNTVQRRAKAEPTVTDLDTLNADSLELTALSPVSELVVVDASVPDKHLFYSQLKPGQKILEIKSDVDGLKQLTSALNEYQHLDALHIISHAESGVLHLGNSKIDSQRLTDEVSLFSTLNSALKPGADIHFYGCDLAAGIQGEEFLDIVQGNTHADIAASNNLTGNADKGGDWELEIQRGQIDSNRQFSALALKDFSDVLAYSGTITMAGFSYAYFAEAIYTVGGSYNFRIKSDTGNANDLWGYNFKNIYVNAGGGQSLTSVDMDFTGGESFDATSLYLKNCQGSNQTFRVTSDKGGSVDSSSLADLAGQTLNFSGAQWEGVTKVTLQMAGGGTLACTHFDNLVVANVAAPNATPVATAPSAPTVSEDATNVALADTIQVADTDAGDTQIVTFTITGGTLTTGTGGIIFGGGGNGSASFTAQGSLTNINTALDAATFSSTADLNGSNAGTIAFKSNDGFIDSNTASVSFNITSVNDEPSFTKGGNETLLEDSGFQIVNSWATALNKGATDESSQTLSFALTNDNNGLFSSQPAISAAGQLTYTPVSGANGASTVSIVLTDDGGTAGGGDDTYTTQTFTVTVHAVNDEPSFTKGANQSALNTAGAQTVSGWGTALSKGPADEGGQSLTFTLLNDNNALFSAQPAIDGSGNLTYTPAASQSGVANVSITLRDDGGTADGGDDTFAAQVFTITVNAAAPTITSATYNGSTGALVVSGTNFAVNAGGSDVDVSDLTLTGEDGSAYALTDSADVNITSGTAFSVNLSVTDKLAVNGLLNRNGTVADTGTTYNLAAADDFITNVTAGDTADSTNAITVSNVVTPTLTSATYDASTGVFVVTGANFVSKVGASNDVVNSQFRLFGESSNSRLLTTSDVEVTSATQFTVTLNASDKTAVNLFTDRNGSQASDFATNYYFSAADDWMAAGPPSLDIADSVTLFTVSGIADSDGSLTASAIVTEPVGLGTTVTSSGAAVDLFDFTLTDGGAADGLAMTVSQVVLNVSGTSTDTERGQITWSLNGNDASNVTGSYSAVANTVTFSGLSISIADNTSETYTVNGFFNNNTNITEDLTVILSIDGDTDLTVGSGTQMAATTPITNVSGTTLDVAATTLSFTTHPAGSVSGSALTTQPVVTARDAAGNTDVDFTEVVTLTEASAGTLSSNTKTAVDGVATFTGLAFTAIADQEGFTLTANDVDGTGSNLPTVNASSVFSDVVAIQLVFTTQPAGSVSGSALTTQPVVTARDANGITDTGFTETVTLTEASAGSITSNTAGSISGVATFSGVVYTATADQQSFTLTANDQDGIDTDISTTDASAVTSDVIATKLVFDTQPAPLIVTSGTATSFTTVPVISAKDANDVVDTGYTNTIDIAEINGAGSALISGTGDSDGDAATVSLTPVSGVATFTALQATYTLGGASSETFNLQVSSSSLSIATSSQFTAELPAPDPAITSAAYDGGTGVLTVTGTNFVANSGADNDVDTSLLTIIGHAGNTRSLTAAADVEITNSTTFSVTLSGAEKDAVDLLLNKVGSAADDATTYNLAAAEDWMPGALVASNIADLTGNGIIVSNPVDTVKPRVINVSSSSGMTSSIVGDFIPVVITFSENVVITGTPQIELETGATDHLVDRVGPSSGISALKFDYQVQVGDISADLAYKAINSLTLNGGTIKDSAGNNAVLTLPVPGAAGSLSANKNHVVDGIVPTVAITGVPTNSNTAFTATFTFSEVVTGLFESEIIVGNGVRSSFSGSGKVYTVTVTPQAEGNVTVGLNPGSVIDVTGNTNAAPVSAASNYDITKPTVTISGVPANSNAAFTSTFTFNEAVTDFDATDITLANATKGVFTAISSTVYTLIVTPTGAAVTIDVTANSAIDVANNGNVAAPQATSTFDNTAPRVSNIFRAIPTSSPTNADSLTWTITFNEVVNNLDVTDFEVTGTTATVQSINKIGESNYNVTVSGGDLASFNGTATLVIASGHNLKDRAGNALTNLVPTHLNIFSFVVDNTAPTLTLSAPSEISTKSGPITYTVTYSNADNITLALGNITLNKTGSAVGTLALSGTGNTRTVTISGISGDGTLGISIAANTASDDAGNNAAAANSATLTVASNQAGTINISGKTIVGESLTAAVTDADGLTNVTITYQWTSGGNSVGTNSNSYTLQASDVGKTISVNAQYSDQGGAAENINSTATAAIITVQTDAVNRISSTANQAGGTPPTVDDYKTAGISDVSDAVLTRILPLINSAVARQGDSADVDSESKLQTLVNTILEGQDNDEDGLPNMVEGTGDTDNDGTTDREDTDSDNDGVADQLEVRLTLTDSDSDGIIDLLDADVGNDGEVDTSKVDANFDGVDDALDSMAELIAKAIADIQAAPSSNGEVDLPFKQFNQDQDQRPNHLDLDTDNDGIMDVVESGLSDTDGDGKLDTGDAVITDGSKLLDGDADSLPNMLEVKSDGISFDLSVNGLPDTLDTDANGILDSTIDMDRDGIIDSVDNAVGAQGTLPDVDKDGIPNHADTDDDGDGIPDVDENSQQQYFTGKDADADGIDDGVDQSINGVLDGEDVNKNGVRDDRELSDMDNDGIADHLDADSDNDGIQDGQDIVINVGDDVKSEGAGAMNVMMMLSLLLLSALRYSRGVLRTSAVVLLWLSSTISHAQSWQVNLGLGQSSLEPELANGLDTDEGGDRAVQLGLGYRISSDLLVELRYSDLGKTDIRGSQGHSTLGYKSWALDTKYQLPLLQGTVWSPYVLGGISINQLQADDLSLEKKTDPGLMLGAGISYRFQEFQLNSELIRYSDDIAGWYMGIQKDF